MKADAILTAAACLLASLCAVKLTVPNEQTAAATAKSKETLTFYLSGVECPSCIYSVWQAVNPVKGVSDVAVQQRIDSFANVTFDPRVVSAQQIASVVTEAWPLHGKPYTASLNLSIPDYAKGDNAAKVDAVFARQKKWVEIEALDKAKGEFSVAFLPIKTDEKKTGAQGWNPEALIHAIADSSPKGLGLECEIVRSE